MSLSDVPVKLDVSEVIEVYINGYEFTSKVYINGYEFAHELRGEFSIEFDDDLVFPVIDIMFFKDIKVKLDDEFTLEIENSISESGAESEWLSDRQYSAADAMNDFHKENR